MSKAERCRAALAQLAVAEWDGYLMAESGLPGPRANLELAAVVAEMAPDALLRRYRTLDAQQAPANTPGEFLAFCGVLGLGRELRAGRGQALTELRGFASDARWRTREAVAMALQHWGDADRPALLDAMTAWAAGSRLEQRAAVAAVCEPRLLQSPEPAQQALALLDGVTASLVNAPDERADGFRVLRQALGYGWSVAVAALPAPGRAAFERWLNYDDANVRWVLRENLKKTRLARMDPAWVERLRQRLA
jgi:hypothetical protein